VNVAEKFVGGLIVIGVITTAVLPKRQTAAVINAFTGLIRGGLGTAITGSTK
jgi:hypothetical protein